MMDKFKQNYHYFVLIFGILLGGFISVAIGKEVNWDMANYHFYNPFAFLSHRIGMDYWPAEFIHVHIAPTADFLTYFLISTFKPKTAVFAIGALHGVNLWLLFLIARQMIGDIAKHAYAINSLALLCAVVGMYGPTALPGLGSFQHDQLVSMFVFVFILIFLHRDNSSFRTIVAGAVLGAAVGLKLTAGIYAAGALAAVLFSDGTYGERSKLFMQISLGILIGILCTSGYWMLMMWKSYHNPIFPFFNNIFHSAQFPATSWADKRFLPHTWQEALLFPFYFSLDGRTGDLPFRDFRFAFAYGLLLLLAVRVLLGAMRYTKMPAIKPEIKWFLLFFVFSYVAWQCGFSIMRYAMAMEMLAPLLIVLMLNYLLQDATLKLTMGVGMFAVLIIVMQPVRVIRLPEYSGSYFNVRVPHLSQHPQHTHNAMVLMAFPSYALDVKPRPQTYLIPFLPKQWRYVGVPFTNRKYHLPQEVFNRVRQFKGQFYVMSSSEFLPQMNLAAWQMGLRSGGVCGNITSDRQRVTHEDVLLCPFYKI